MGCWPFVLLAPPLHFRRERTFAEGAQWVIWVRGGLAPKVPIQNSSMAHHRADLLCIPCSISTSHPCKISRTWKPPRNTPTLTVAFSFSSLTFLDFHTLLLLVNKQQPCQYPQPFPIILGYGSNSRQLSSPSNAECAFGILYCRITPPSPGSPSIQSYVHITY